MSEPGLNKKMDPGWNDPPTLTYNASNPPPKSRITNKRVAFPLSSNKPLPTPVANIPPTDVNTQTSLENFDSEATLKQILANLEVCEKKLSNPNSVLKEKTEIFKTMWKDNKLNKHIQKLILDMTEHIINSEMGKANECQLQLMIESAVLCEPWIAIFRQLVSNEEIKK